MRQNKKVLPIAREILTLLSQVPLEQISHGKLVLIITDYNPVCIICEEAKRIDKNQLGCLFANLVRSGFKGNFRGKILDDYCIVYIEKRPKEGKMALDNTFEWEVEKAASAA